MMTPEALFEKILPPWRAAAAPVVGLDFFPQRLAALRGHRWQRAFDEDMNHGDDT